MNNFWNKNVVFFRQINNWKITKIQDPLTWQKWAGHTWMVPMKKRRITKVYSAPFTIDTATFQVDNDTEKCFLISIKSIYIWVFFWFWRRIFIVSENEFLEWTEYEYSNTKYSRIYSLFEYFYSYSFFFFWDESLVW